MRNLMLDVWAWRCKCAIKWARLSIHDIMCMVRNRVDGEHSAAIFGAELRQPNNFQHDFKMAEFPIVETLVPPRMQGGICNRSSNSTANNVLHQHVHGNKQHKHRSTQTLQNYNGHKQYTNIANITNSWVLNNITRHSTRTVQTPQTFDDTCVCRVVSLVGAFNANEAATAATVGATVAAVACLRICLPLGSW